MNGAEFVLECLRQEGVDTIFGYPGGTVIPLFDALYKVDHFDLYRPCHEQGGVHAADGYARATGRPGVAIVTSGPGVTNAVTGIATAYLDSIPLVLITGQVGTSVLYKSSFQEVDTTGLMMPITKHSRLVTDPDDIADAIAEAFYMANEGRKGPVVVDITKDAFLKEVKDTSYASRPLPVDDRLEQYEKEFQDALRLIREAERPVLYAGGGVLRSGSSEELRHFAEQCNIPVANSIMGLGSFDRMHPLSLGVVGMHGQKDTNLTVYNADLVIGVGVRFSDRAIGNREGFTEGARIIHIDIDAAEFNKNLDTHVEILGDMKTILKRLAEELRDVRKPDFKDAETADPDRDYPPRRVLETMQAFMPDNTNVVTDVGQHQMWSMQYWKVRQPDSFFTSGGLGTMGYGAGAALGAKVGRKDRPVLWVTGDGCFRMDHIELLTASKYQIPITCLVFNNNALGMVRQWQDLFHEKRFSETDIYDPLDIELLCQAYGIEYAGRFTSPEELEALLEGKTFTEGIRVLEYVLDHDLGVYPMVAAGSPINNLIERIVN